MYPSDIDTFTIVSGTTLQGNADHASMHNVEGSAIQGVENTLGTNSGTSVLKNFAAGDFCAKTTDTMKAGTLVFGVNSYPLGTTALGTTDYLRYDGTSIIGGTVSGGGSGSGTALIFGTNVYNLGTSALLNNEVILYNGTSIVGGSVTSVLNSLVVREPVNETPNGTITNFTIDYPPITNSESGYLNGQLQNVGTANDYTISGTTITFNTPPPVNSVILFTYQRSDLSNGNADTLDGQHGSYYTPVSQNDGWISAGETWTYASASTITVPSGAASKYSKGDRIKFTQTTVKYGVIVAVADTLLTIAVNTDYVVANAAISANYYSHESSPIGYPHWFNWTPTVGASGSMTFTVTTTEVSKFCVNGNMCTSVVHLLGTTGGSASTTITCTLPITPVDAGNYKIAGPCFTWDAAAAAGWYYYISNTLQINKPDGSNWAVTTNRRISPTVSYQI